jgi:hypothetical protein
VFKSHKIYITDAGLLHTLLGIETPQAFPLETSPRLSLIVALMYALQARRKYRRHVLLVQSYLHLLARSVIAAILHCLLVALQLLELELVVVLVTRCLTSLIIGEIGWVEGRWVVPVYRRRR